MGCVGRIKGKFWFYLSSFGPTDTRMITSPWCVIVSTTSIGDLDYLVPVHTQLVGWLVSMR